MKDTIVIMMAIYDEISVIEKSCNNTLYFIFQTEYKTDTMTVKMPNQLFINGEFVEAQTGKTFDTINPADETVSTIGAVNLCIFLAETELIFHTA